MFFKTAAVKILSHSGTMPINVNNWRERVRPTNIEGLREDKQQLDEVYSKIMEKDANFLFITCRALTADEANDNGDLFPDKELRDNFRSFVLRGVYVDHNNDHPSKAKGIILDAEYKPKKGPDNSWVQLVLAIDRQSYPEVCAAVEVGDITDVSMGCIAQTCTCSSCDNVATQESELCAHVRMRNAGDERYSFVYERNEGLDFIEESLITTRGADPKAKLGPVLASVQKESELHPYIRAINASGFDKKSDYYNSMTQPVDGELGGTPEEIKKREELEKEDLLDEWVGIKELGETLKEQMTDLRQDIEGLQGSVDIVKEQTGVPEEAEETTEPRDLGTEPLELEPMPKDEFEFSLLDEKELATEPPAPEVEKTPTTDKSELPMEEEIKVEKDEVEEEPEEKVEKKEEEEEEKKEKVKLPRLKTKESRLTKAYHTVKGWFKNKKDVPSFVKPYYGLWESAVKIADKNGFGTNLGAKAVCFKGLLKLNGFSAPKDLEEFDHPNFKVAENGKIAYSPTMTDEIAKKKKDYGKKTKKSSTEVVAEVGGLEILEIKDNPKGTVPESSKIIKFRLSGPALDEIKGAPGKAFVDSKTMKVEWDGNYELQDKIIQEINMKFPEIHAIEFDPDQVIDTDMLIEWQDDSSVIVTAVVFVDQAFGVSEAKFNNKNSDLEDDKKMTIKKSKKVEASTKVVKLYDAIVDAHGIKNPESNQIVASLKQQLYPEFITEAFAVLEKSLGKEAAEKDLAMTIHDMRTLFGKEAEVCFENLDETLKGLVEKDAAGPTTLPEKNLDREGDSVGNSSVSDKPETDVKEPLPSGSAPKPEKDHKETDPALPKKDTTPATQIEQVKAKLTSREFHAYKEKIKAKIAKKRGEEYEEMEYNEMDYEDYPNPDEYPEGYEDGYPEGYVVDMEIKEYPEDKKDMEYKERRPERMPRREKRTHRAKKSISAQETVTLMTTMKGAGRTDAEIVKAIEDLQAGGAAVTASKESPARQVIAGIEAKKLREKVARLEKESSERELADRSRNIFRLANQMVNLDMAEGRDVEAQIKYLSEKNPVELRGIRGTVEVIAKTASAKDDESPDKEPKGFGPNALPMILAKSNSDLGDIFDENF